MPATRHVTLLIEATNAYARGLLHGVAQYEHEHAGWTVYFEPRDSHAPPPKWLKNWKGDGILARVEDRRIAKAVLAVGVPVVELRRKTTLPGVPSIGPDNDAVTRLAVEHLRERGFRHFGFCGIVRGLDPAMDGRADAFRRHLEEAGFQCNRFEPERGSAWEREERRIAQWVRALPKPAAVMTCNDNLGLQVLRACMSVGVAVPDQVAVIGAGNDDCLCSLAHPPLSSVDLGPESIGYEAAALLDRMMNGRRAPAPHIQVPPRGIITRLSTDVLATEDQAVATAVRFIRGHAYDDIGVGDVLKQVSLSRSALEPKLKRVIGRTIHQEIHRVRLERVKVLLATTELPTKQIAAQAGFHSVQYLARVFRAATGLTAASFRKKMRR
jgi:LacI family transcriptional regulator